MKRWLIMIIFLMLLITCRKKSNNVSSPESSDILKKINMLEKVEAQEISPVNGFERQFEVYITQPLDHLNPNGEQFKQRIFISHTDEKNPVIFMPSGYSSSPTKVCELSGPFLANQIYVAHRFMAGAEPDSRDWRYLTIEQASADFHEVVELLKEIYTGPWLSYGVSKNGQAALYHRRFYPTDTKATVAIGSALSLSTEDPRYDSFLEQVGSESDREKIINFQQSVLLKRNLIIPMIRNYMENSDFSFTRTNADEILEFEILEFPFSFWQVSDGNCSGIPDSSASPSELYNYLREFGYFDFYSDELLEYFQPIYYQAYTELGWYPLNDDHLQDLLVALPDPSYRMMAPQGVELNYDPNVMLDIIHWLQNYGNNIIYIYGGNDPWSAGAIESVGITNALKIVQPDANHSIRISNLDQAGLVYSTLEKWLNVSTVKQ